MKSLTKRIGAFTAAGAMSLSLIVGSGLITGKNVFAEDNKDYCNKYYYNKLSDDSLAENFYNTFETLAKNGDFKKGTVEYDLIANSVATEDDVAAYVNGTSDKLVKSYAAGRDAFYMDHPDLFYVELFATSISAGQTSSGEYAAYLDSSRVLTTYKGNLDSEAKVNAAIGVYDNAVNAIVTEANKKTTVVDKIEYVNNYIIEHNNYGWGTKVENGRNVDTPKAAFIYTSYGALVNNESVCEGYAKSFKAVMDRLEIPCVLISGYVEKQGVYEPHMWNYVQVEDMWYGVDVTYNSEFNNKYLLCGGEDMDGKYVAENIVSSSEYKLAYPAIKPYAYGSNTDGNGMNIEGSYTEKNGDKYLSLTVSVDGKGAAKLEEEGLYLAYRFSETKDGEIVWNNWVNIVEMNKFMLGYYETSFIDITDTETKVNDIGTGVARIQFALLNRAPDGIMGSYTQVADGDFVISPSTPYINDGYKKTELPPYAVKVTPSNTATLRVNQTLHITIEYSKKLALADDKLSASMDFTTEENDATIKNYAKIANFKFDGEKTVSFDFTPSQMYAHNRTTYYFTPVNLVGAENGMVPDRVNFSFGGKSVYCSKVYNDGRYYVTTYGNPVLVDSSDLSVTDFQDENGNYFSESQRSQLMLVASKPTAAQEEEMDSVLKDKTGVTDADIVSSSTYEIDLQLCSLVKTIPNGSYMQVAFGFPEGYSPDDAGTTFKIYHYKRENGKIVGVEEIPVVVTQYGLIAKVTSFSPFAIVQLKNTSAAVTDTDTVNVYASVNGSNGGTLTTNGKGGISEVTEDTITYDIKADTGYTVGTVLLNGKVVDASAYEDGKLTLNKSDLSSSNTLEVTFVTKTSADFYAEKGFTPVYGATRPFVNATDNSASNNAVVIAVVVVAVVVVIAGAGIATWLVIRSRKNNA